MSRRCGCLAAVLASLAGCLVMPAVAAACTDTPVLGQACEVGEAGLDAADVIRENTIDGPLPGATNDEPITGVLSNAASDIAGAVAEPIFEQIATVTTDAAAWLIGKVTGLIDATTSPDLLSRGFVDQYRQMAGIAALLAAAMLLLAVIEGLARGDMALLGRVLIVNLPLAFLATSSAYVVVQLLLGATDQMSHAVAQSTGDNTHRFLHGATEGLSAAGAAGGAGAGGPLGASAGAVGVPVFAVIIAALVAIVAGFLVWIELVMRDAAVYVVALFLPMALAASIWPRWTGALRRTSELLVAIIASKFVIVSIIALAAGLMADNERRFEHVIAATALLLLACFAPLVLMKLVPFAEGAMAAAYARRSGGGLALSGLQLASSAQMMRATSRANWERRASGQGLNSRGTPTSQAAGAAAAGPAAAGAGLAAGSAGAAAAPVRGSRAAAAALEPTAAAQSPDPQDSRPPRPEGPRPQDPPTPSKQPPESGPAPANEGPPRPPHQPRRQPGGEGNA